MNTVSNLTINNETREIADAQSREDIAVLKEQVEINTANIEYIAMMTGVDLDDKSGAE